MATPIRRFGWLYAAAWLPYFGLHVFFVIRERGLGDALVSAVIGVVPPAVFGLGVLAWTRRRPWTGERRVRFVLLQVAGAAVYTVVVTACTWGLYALHQLVVRGGINPESFRPANAVFTLFFGVMFYAVLASLSYAWQFLERLRREQERTARAETMRTQAELKALRAQLNPHFLFNTLHTLLALVRQDARAAEEALEQFGDLLRYSLGVHQDGREDVPLAEEWTFLRNYLAIERLRLGERLRLDLDAEPEALDCEVPTFTLQPLVENAIRHAIAPRAAGGSLAVAARVEDSTLVLEVRDDGPGADLAAVESSPGMGLRLVRQRLETFYDGRAECTVTTSPGEGFAVVLRVPVT